MKNILFSTFLLTTVFISCNSDKNQIAGEFETNKKNVIDSLVSKYNIIYNLDTVNAFDYYSVDCKPIIDSKYQLIDDIWISDIYEEDSAEYVSIRTGYHFYFDFLITKEQEKKLIGRDRKNDLIFIVSITQIRKIKLSIEGGGAIANIDYSHDFIGKGKLIDIVSIKQQPGSYGE